MRIFLHNILKVLILTVLILCSYSYIESHGLVRRLQNWMEDTATEYLTPEDQKNKTGSLEALVRALEDKSPGVLRVRAAETDPAAAEGTTQAASLQNAAQAAVQLSTEASGQESQAVTEAAATSGQDSQTATDAPAASSQDSQTATDAPAASSQNSQAITETQAASGLAESRKEANDSSARLGYRAVWLSYIEFMEYLESVEDNTEENFRAFYNRVADKAKEAGMTTIIVQVRPFGDALYPSKYFPWASCISGRQGRDPGYDPLKIMVEISHKKGLAIEAWINPYRILSTTDTSILSRKNLALGWMKSKDKKIRDRVLTYDGALYYNPAKPIVRKLIILGICEIINNYQVDGIHLDDYFYPDFDPETVTKTFDYKDYKTYCRFASAPYRIYPSGMDSIFTWRRNNVSKLVSDIYKAVKATNPNLSFGVSPSGNLEDLRSNYQYYVDIDRWVTEPGYVDYLAPQLYWSYFNPYAPYKNILNQWVSLMKDSQVDLYIGLPLYRMAATDTPGLEGFEFQQAVLMKYMLDDIKKNGTVKGIALFSYEYLDMDSRWYDFESTAYTEEQKKILREVFQIIKNMDWNAG